MTMPIENLVLPGHLTVQLLTDFHAQCTYQQHSSYSTNAKDVCISLYVCTNNAKIVGTLEMSQILWVDSKSIESFEEDTFCFLTKEDSRNKLKYMKELYHHR